MRILPQSKRLERFARSYRKAAYFATVWVDEKAGLHVDLEHYDQFSAFADSDPSVKAFIDGLASIIPASATDEYEDLGCWPEPLVS